MALVRRQEIGKPVISAQPFLRASTVLREAAAILQRYPLMDTGMPTRLLEAVNRARDEEFQRISQELQNSLEALRSTAAESEASGWVRR
jgi:hypothetical protein